MFERGLECLYVWVYVFFPFILNVMFVGCISRESHRRKVTQDLFSSHLPSAVHAFIFLARRIQPFLSLVGRYVQFLCTNDVIVLHLLGIFMFIFYFLVRENPSY